MRKPKPLDPQRFQLAVTCLALHRAKTKVIEQIRADGDKISRYSAREIAEKRDAYFTAHSHELVTQAIEDAWRLPMFARYRQTQTKTQTQPQGQPI